MIATFFGGGFSSIIQFFVKKIVISFHIHHYSLGNAWEEGIYNPEQLEEVTQLLPLEKPTENEVSGLCPDLTKESESDETEPNCTVYETLNIKKQENICNCIFSTKTSSLTVDKDLKSICTCNVDYEKQMSIINKQSVTDHNPPASPDLTHTKERHMSVDSARDSGIGENSNLTDVDTIKYDESADESTENANEASTSFGCNEEVSASDMRGLWQPKIKQSLVDRLPKKSFYVVHPSRYIFPGAEVYYDPDEKFHSLGDSGSDSSENESDNLDVSF